MADKKPVQHTPKHVGNVPDARHPAASSFAPLQPAAGVVADDVEEKGQNLAGGPTASDANKEHEGQVEELREQHYAEREVETPPSVNVEGGQATPIKPKK